ncbi:MAG: hypothetical protein ACRDZO_07180 [Egibacteraceae bacterium]
MTLIGIAILPAAPVLVPGVSVTLPDDLRQVRDATEACVEDLPGAEAVVLLAVGDPSGPYRRVEASLAGFGRPDLAVSLCPADGAEGHDGALPPSLAVLAMMLRHNVPVAPIALGSGASARDLHELGACLARRSRRIVAIAAGDLSAGLEERSPRSRIHGAQAWDEAVLTAVVDGDRDALARLGPGEARRVVAQGWAPILATVSAGAAAALDLRLLHYSAPRGVGYLVAHG